MKALHILILPLALLVCWIGSQSTPETLEDQVRTAVALEVEGVTVAFKPQPPKEKFELPKIDVPRPKPIRVLLDGVGLGLTEEHVRQILGTPDEVGSGVLSFGERSVVFEDGLVVAVTNG